MEKMLIGVKTRQFFKKLYKTYEMQAFSVPNKVIADKCSMPISTVNKYLGLLVKSNYLTRQPIEDIFAGKNSAKFHYQISDSGIQFINSITFTNSAHQDLVDNIQSDTFKEKFKKSYDDNFAPEREERYKLNSDDCILLLELLLCHANKYGVVIGLTRDNISNIIGFKASKIRRLTKVLLSMELILQMTPGISGLFGIQASIYQLSLNHVLYEQDNRLSSFATASIEFQYAENIKLPVVNLVGQVLGIHFIKEKYVIKNVDKEKKTYFETLDELNPHFTAPKQRISTYILSLMNIFSAQIIAQNDDLKELINLLSNFQGYHENKSKGPIIDAFKDFLESTVLSTTRNIRNIDNVINVLRPFFLDNLLHIGLLASELKKFGYSNVVSVNSTITSLYPQSLQITMLFASRKKVQGEECNNFSASLGYSLATKDGMRRYKISLTPTI